MDYTIAILVGALISSVIVNVVLWKFANDCMDMLEKQRKLIVKINTLCDEILGKNKRLIEKWLDKHMD
ncbi:hypothetical protein E34_1564 [Lactococcus lactis subsp. lactis]|uniref:DUF1660 family phage protein n=1 Tax=Lactococcus lactis TaxID=1358 RepID=UPI00071C790D|nr:DUF1660 family phage protein [Lactococcus lactis]KST78041.1 hypothetical protein E34_1564 [Lactococcus lactis subsp. lactis]